MRAMEDNDAVVASIEARIRAERDAEQSAEFEGALMLEELWKQLQPYQDKYGVHIDMEERPSAAEKGIRIAREGQEIARWNRRGQSLLLQFPRGLRAPVGHGRGGLRSDDRRAGERAARPEPTTERLYCCAERPVDRRAGWPVALKTDRMENGICGHPADTKRARSRRHASPLPRSLI
jgi:hypothetical protein